MNEDKIREAFEQNPRYDFEKDENGYYVHAIVADAFVNFRDGYQAATRAAVPAWLPIETMPNDDGSWIVADAKRGCVAPYIRGVIHNNTGSMWDWQYGEAITHWMPLPPAPEESHD